MTSGRGNDIAYHGAVSQHPNKKSSVGPVMVTMISYIRSPVNSPVISNQVYSNEAG